MANAAALRALLGDILMMQQRFRPEDLRVPPEIFPAIQERPRPLVTPDMQERPYTEYIPDAQERPYTETVPDQQEGPYTEILPDMQQRPEIEKMFIGPKARGWKEIPDERKWQDKVDKKFRSEISDKLMKLLRKPDQPDRVNFIMRQLVDHPELYRQYPQLADMPITVSQGQGDDDGGSFDPRTNRVTSLGFWRTKDPKWADDKKETVIHEMQHAIQKIEGTARGGSPVQFILSTPENKKIWKDFGIEEQMEGYHDYHDNIYRPAFERFREQNNKKSWREAYDAFQETTIGLRDYLLYTFAEDAARKPYNALHGEAEARTASRRRNLSLQERLGTMNPNVTEEEGGPLSKQIYYPQEYTE